MPYEIRKEDGKFCLHKKGETAPMACHTTEEEAMAQMRALYAAEAGGKSATVKFAAGDENTLEGLGMPYGGPHQGQDLAGEHFDAETDFCFDWFKAGRPLLFHHGLDKDAGTSVIGTVTEWKKTDLGVWVRAQLDAHNEFVNGVKELVRKGALFFSSGAMGHLVRKDAKTGAIKVWPWVELSTTPTPCNLLATLDFATAKSHFKAIDVELAEGYAAEEASTVNLYGSPNPLELLLKATLDAEALNKLSDADFAYIDSNGGKHLPINDEAHVRNALARFNQTQFESAEAKEKAHKKILAAAKRMGIETTEGKAGGGVNYNFYVGGSFTGAPETLATWDGSAWSPMLRTMSSSNVPEEMMQGAKPVEKKPSKTMDMMKRMATEMGMKMSEAEMQDMAMEMGDISAMDEAEAKGKMKEMLQKKKDSMSSSDHQHKAITAFINQLVDEDVDLSEVPMASHTEAVKILATSLMERTKDLHERRIKEGRTLSVATRKRMKDSMDAMRGVLDEMCAFLDSTEPQPAKAASVRLQFEMLKLTLMEGANQNGA